CGRYLPVSDDYTPFADCSGKWTNTHGLQLAGTYSTSSMDNVCKKHKRIFTPERGKLQGFAAKLYIETEAKPRFFCPQPIALSLKQKRLPFGVSSAPLLFQRTVENLLSGLNHVSVYLDDILVTEINEADHLQNLHAVLQGLKEAESKVEAICKAPTPTNVTELKLFLGLLVYYLTDVKWKWTTDHQEAFQQAKSLLHSSSVLVHYDEKKPLIIACDAFHYGLGAILSH
uniref:Reverse transcriptase domain-containing protein n=1 Tax=Amphimedon queenslandica TaxID=400682 RepID=A0A1X7U5C2_AMPQE